MGHSDYALRCVRMTAINLALRNLYGYVIWGNSLGSKSKLVYRTGFNLRGFVQEITPGEGIPVVPPENERGAEPPTTDTTMSSSEIEVVQTSSNDPPIPTKQLRLF
jgi:hypothetical protein